MDTATEFSHDELFEYAQGNLNGFVLTTISYLKGQGRSVEEWVSFVGTSYAPAWEEMRGKGGRELMRVAALNAASAGALLESLSGDDTEAEATIANWPSPELLDFVGLSQSDVEPFWNIFRPVMDSLGFDYQYRSQGDRHTFTIRKR